MRNPYAPLRRAGDSPRMREAIDQLEALCVTLYRPTDYQLKVGKLNFYPDKGTIQFDACPALAERGLHAFLALIKAGRT